MYPSGYNFKDLMHLSTSLVVMAIDVVGDRHRTNFCREELAPSLDNGALTWRKTQDRLEGSAVCNNDFLLINKGKSTSHCDRKAGWVMSEQCVSRHPVEVGPNPIPHHVRHSFKGFNLSLFQNTSVPELISSTPFAISFVM